MARVPGFEPGNGGIKILCLTAWRHPIDYFMVKLRYHCPIYQNTYSRIDSIV